MNIWSGIRRAAVCVLIGTMGRAETWRTTRSETIEGSLAGIYGPLALITAKSGSTTVPLELLDDAALNRVADFLARPAAAPWKSSSSKVAKALRNRLQTLRNGKLVTFDPEARPEPEFYLVYFGAHWCGPCRRFSPRLVSRYAELKQAAPDAFEVIFVSSDRDAEEQVRYVREAAMPWPVLRFSDVGRASVIERWSGRGIPCLVVLTRDGDLLYHSYRGEEYLGPDEPLKNFSALLAAMQGRGHGAKRATHRLAVLQHVRAAAGGARAVQPYVIDLDLGRYQTLEARELVATLELDEQGRVVDTKIQPQIPAMLEYQLTNDAGQWLFLPPVKDGKPHATKVQLPLKLR